MYFEQNENENEYDNKICRMPLKQYFRRKFITLNTYFRKDKGLKSKPQL